MTFHSRVSPCRGLLDQLLARGPFDVVAWDFDGVLADSEPVHRDAYLASLRARGVEPEPDFFTACLGLTEGEIWAHLAGRHGLTESTAELRAERMARLLSSAEQRLGPSGLALTLLPVLRDGGARQFVVSSGNVEVVEPLLARWGIRPFFDTVLAWRPGTSTTKRERLAHIAAGASRPLVVEDDRGYLAFARSLGAVTLGVTHSLNRLSEGEADFLAPIEPVGGA